MATQGISIATQADDTLQRSSFPKDFVFGTASSAYQYEGAANKDGRGKSIWDNFTQRQPGKIKDGSNGNVVVDSYNRYKEDVAIMKKMGLDAYRFSISWPRILPSGRLSGGVNKEGIEYYNNLIDELLANGIEPFVTLFHWDLPQPLEDEYGGFLSSRITVDFCDYAEVCFWEFGDRVKHWITFNEPWTFSVNGYVTGNFAPGRGTSSPENIRSIPHACRSSSCHQHTCTNGDPNTEPYQLSHNQLLAHAAAVELYRQKYQRSQRGKIGITLVVTWTEPLEAANENDKKAAERAIDFMFGWFMDPLTTGDYPKSMRSLVGSRLPNFSKEQSELIKGSLDFLGLNYYSANYATQSTISNNGNLSYNTDSQVILSTEKNGIPIGPKAAPDWLHIYPEGIYKLLKYIKNKYDNPVVYITENGNQLAQRIYCVGEEDDVTLTLSEARHDETRKEYHDKHLHFVQNAINKGSKVKGYFVWSLLDNFEWGDGYTICFGMIHVDYKNDLSRYPKYSAIWFMNFLKKESKSSKKRLIPFYDDGSAKAPCLI